MEIEQESRNRTKGLSGEAVIPPGTENPIVCRTGISCKSSNKGADQNVDGGRTKTHMLTRAPVTDILGQQGRIDELVGDSFLNASSGHIWGIRNHLSPTKLNSLQDPSESSWDLKESKPPRRPLLLQLQYYRCLNYHFKSLPRHLSMALQAHPCKSDKDKLLLGHLSWPWSLDRDKLFIIPAPSLLRVQHTGGRLEKCYRRQLSQSCGLWPWVLGQGEKGGFDALKKFLWDMEDLQLLQKKCSCMLVSKGPYNS